MNYQGFVRQDFRRPLLRRRIQGNLLRSGQQGAADRLPQHGPALRQEDPRPPIRHHRTAWRHPIQQGGKARPPLPRLPRQELPGRGAELLAGQLLPALRLLRRPHLLLRGRKERQAALRYRPCIPSVPAQHRHRPRP